MKIVRKSYFKNGTTDLDWFKNWVLDLENQNGYTYTKQVIETSLGHTQVYGLNTETDLNDTLVIFPGFRTTALIWDLDRGLRSLTESHRIFFIETNGQPNLSKGDSPAIRSLDYGTWGQEVFDALKIDQAFVAGASFGGLIAMKLALVIPQRIKATILLNPGCFRTVSFGFENLYYNLLPIIRPNQKNLVKFLDHIIFNRSEKYLSPPAEKLLIDYLLFAITNYKDHTQKPYYMKDQLNQVKVDTYLILGNKDILLPYQKSLTNAKHHLKSNIKQVYIEDHGHGIELYPKAIAHIKDIINAYQA